MKKPAKNLLSVTEAFHRCVLDNPHWSSLTCFNAVIEGKPISKVELRKLFSKLVDKEDTVGCREEAFLYSFSLVHAEKKHNRKSEDFE